MMIEIMIVKMFLNKILVTVFTPIEPASTNENPECITARNEEREKEEACGEEGEPKSELNSLDTLHTLNKVG